MAKAAVLSLGWPLMLLAVAAIALLIRGFATRWAREVVQGGWLLLAGLLCCLGSTVPLATLLAEGVIPGEHERTLLLADTMLLVGLGGLILAFSKMTSVLRHLPTLALLALLGQRGYEAWQDTHDWHWPATWLKCSLSQPRNPWLPSHPRTSQCLAHRHHA